MPMGLVRSPFGVSTPSDDRPLGCRASTRSDHVYFGTAAAIWSGVPPDERQLVSVPSGFMTWFARTASSQAWPPPYDSPVTPIPGIATDASTSNPPRYCVSCTSYRMSARCVYPCEAWKPRAVYVTTAYPRWASHMLL